MRSLVFVGLCVSLCACEDPAEEDAGPTDSGLVIDTGPRDTGVDAGFLDAAPGDTDRTDAPPVDADPTDADPTDVTISDGGPRTGPVTIRFAVDGPFSGAGMAIFQDSNGSIVITRTTTVGEIVETIEEGSMVTVAPLDVQGSIDLFTITEIAPNETYNIAAYDQPALLGAITLNIGGAYSGATEYSIEYGCQSGLAATNPTSDVTVNIYAGCVDSSSMFAFLSVAKDQTGQRLAFRLVEDVPFVPGASVTLTNPWRTDFDVFDFDGTNPPANAYFMSLSASVESNGNKYDNNGVNLDFVGGALHYSFLRPPFGDGVSTRFFLFGEGRSWMLRSTSPPTSSTFDLSADFLPFPAPVALTPSPIVGRPTATWQLIPGLDFVELQALSPSLGIKWKVYLRGEATTFLYPELPIDLAAFGPVDLSNFQSATIVIDADSIADYAAARGKLGASLYNWQDQFESDHEPPASRVRGAGFDLDFD